MLQPSQRQLKVAGEVQEILLRALTEQRLHTLSLDRNVVSITEVRMSPDLRHAKVFINTLNNADAKPVLEELKAVKGEMKKLIAKNIRMKFTPDLSFELDDRPNGARRIDEILSTPKVSQDIKKAYEANKAPNRD